MKTTPEQRQQEFQETEQRALEYLRDATAIPSATPLDGYCLRFRRKPLHDFITSFGVLAYPVASTGVVAFVLRLSRKEDRMFSLVILTVCVMTLTRFIMLGVFTAALEL